MTNSVLYIIIQAGGRGSRLRHHTWNKPKCLVSVYGKPIIYHLFQKFPTAKFIIIGDYLYDQLENYLNINPPPITYQLIKAKGDGTASGIVDALKLVPKEASLLITWSDIIINSLPAWPSTETVRPVVCTTSSFTCRWTVSKEGYLHEQPSNINGIPGLFFFPTASLLPLPPEQGEFVKWFAANIVNFDLLDCPDIEELGDFSTIEESNNREGFCRFFNKVEVHEDRVIKSVVDLNYKDLHEKEIIWYSEAEKLGFRRIPKILGKSPLVLQKINGQHAYQMADLNSREQRSVMADYLDSLISLHDLAQASANSDDINDVYLYKTLKRVQSVAGIIPNFNRESITINGKKCKNPFSKKYENFLETLMPQLIPTKFVPIHGDPTFSNTLIDNSLRVWFIDPRGYFSKPGIMGDAWYDFAKVYYSSIGGYDAFNRHKFKLYIDKDTVEILMEEPILSKTAKQVFNTYFKNEIGRIEILHGLIWLALSGYAKDDIDSIIGSYYLGLYWLEVGCNSL